MLVCSLAVAKLSQSNQLWIGFKEAVSRKKGSYRLSVLICSLKTGRTTPADGKICWVKQYGWSVVHSYSPKAKVSEHVHLTTLQFPYCSPTPPSSHGGNALTPAPPYPFIITFLPKNLLLLSSKWQSSPAPLVPYNSESRAEVCNWRLVVEDAFLQTIDSNTLFARKSSVKYWPNTDPNLGQVWSLESYYNGYSLIQ